MALENNENPSQIRAAMQRAQTTTEAKDNRPQQENTERTSRRDESRGDRAGGQRYASLSEIGRANPTPIAMTNTAEVLNTFRRDFVEAMPSKDDNNLINAQVFAIDAATAGIPFSLVVVAGTKRGKETLGVGYHTFLLAGSAETLRPREESYRGNRITIVQVAGDGWDSRSREVVRDVLGRHFGQVNLYSGDAEVIDEGFPTAKDDPTAIADCVKNAFAAIKTAIDRADPDVPKLRLTADDESYATIHVQHRQNHVFDRGHQPVRADVIIDLQTRDNRGRNSRDSIDQLVTGQRIIRTGGYFDFVYAPAEGAAARNDLYARRNGRPSGEEFQLYALRFITTFTDTADFSEESMILAQAIVNAVGDSNEVMRAFEPNLALGEDDTRNIGALAIEPNLQEMDRGFGERWETKNSAFTPAKRQAFLRAVLNPGIIYSIDVPECGAASWQNLNLLAAAQGNKKAMDRYYDAACVLTDGHFEDLYRRTDPIVDEHIERIHGGKYHEGAGGHWLDIRDFDYRALLNMLKPEKESDLEEIQKWGMAASVSDDTPLSQSDRFEIIKNFVPSAVITQFFQRYNYNRLFNEALVEAVNRCKLSLNPTSHGRDGGERFRTTYGNLDQILNRPGSGGLYRNQRSGRDRFDEDRYYGRGERRNNDDRW